MFVFSVSFKVDEYVSCRLCHENNRGPVFSMLRASGLVHHVQQCESKLNYCQGQGSVEKHATLRG